MCVCLFVWVCELHVYRGWHSWCFEAVYVGWHGAWKLRVCVCVCAYACVCVCLCVCVLYMERLVCLTRPSRLFWAAGCVCVCLCGFWVHEKVRIVHALRFSVFDRWVCVWVRVWVCIFVCKGEEKERVCRCVFNTYIYTCVHMCGQYIHIYI